MSKANILAIIYLPEWHLESEELSLAFDMLKKSLTADCDIQISHQAISSELLYSLADTASPDSTHYAQYIIVNSGCLLSPQWLETAQNYWQESTLDIPLVFSSLADHDAPEAYFTLYGFNQYCHHLLQQNNSLDTLAYDQREVQAITFLSSHLEQLAKHHPDSLLTTLHSQSVILPAMHYHFFGHYYEGSREDVLTLIPRTIDSLLDIGCGTGEFARKIKDNFNILVEGIEANTYQATLARQKLDQVYTGDACQLEIERRYDFITCLDMIEHLPDANILLKKIADQWLKPGGQLLLSVPNIAHWSVIEELFAGEFNYIPAGLLCNTHRRFYTRKTMTECLEDCGFKAIKIIPQTTYIPDRIKHSVESIAHMMKVDQQSLQTHDYKFLVTIAQ